MSRIDPMLAEGARLPKAKGPAHFGYVDALRGWAFLGVFSTHALIETPGLPERLQTFLSAGHYGVQLFFMMSAFTLFHSIHSRPQRKHWVRDFAIRRILRIAPMFYVAIILYSFQRLKEQGVLPHWPEVLVTATFLHGLSVPYINSLVGGQWSVGDEMLFYALVPLLSRLIVSLRSALVGMIAFLVSNLLANRFVLGHATDPALHWYATLWLPYQLFAFGLGFVLYFVLDHHTSPTTFDLTRRFAPVLLWGGLALTTLVLAYGDRTPVAQKVTSFSLFLLVIGLSHIPNAFLVNRIMREIGRVSYSAYIVHFLALDVVVRLLLPYIHQDRPYERLTVLTIVALPVTLAISALTYRTIEAPGQSMGRNLIQRLRALPTTG